MKTPNYRVWFKFYDRNCEKQVDTHPCDTWADVMDTIKNEKPLFAMTDIEHKNGNIERYLCPS